MKCVICHGEEIQIREVQEELNFENDIVRVSIKVPVCLHCGERYYDRKTMKHLEDVRQKIKEQRNNLKEVGRVMVFK